MVKKKGIEKRVKEKCSEEENHLWVKKPITGCTLNKQE